MNLCGFWLGLREDCATDSFRSSRWPSIMTVRRTGVVLLLDAAGVRADAADSNPHIRCSVALCLTAVPHLHAAMVNVDCNGGAASDRSGGVKPGDVILVQGTCRENLLIPSEVLRITLDGQGKTTIEAPGRTPPRRPVLGREVTIKGFTVTGGTFGIAINRGRHGTIHRNTRPERCDQRA